MKYNFRVNSVNDSFLDIDVEYESHITKEAYGQIKVEPLVKESIMLTTGFRVILNDPLSERLRHLVKEPYVFPRLIKDLKKYKEDYELVEEESDLINYAIREIRKLNTKKQDFK